MNGSLILHYLLVATKKNQILNFNFKCEITLQIYSRRRSVRCTPQLNYQKILIYLVVLNNADLQKRTCKIVYYYHASKHVDTAEYLAAEDDPYGTSSTGESGAQYLYPKYLHVLFERHGIFDENPSFNSDKIKKRTNAIRKSVHIVYNQKKTAVGMVRRIGAI
jgi:hypothetical protein